jgi:ribonuclease-3
VTRDDAPADLAPLVARLGVGVSSPLLGLALTHRSYAFEHGGLPTNERLEFLGDSVLGLAVTDALYRRNPGHAEGRLAKSRSSVVSAVALADVAREIDLGAYVRLGNGEELTGGRDKASILADSLEAVIGAVYLEHGFPTAASLVMRLVGGRLDDAADNSAGTDWKTCLQEHLAARHEPAPQYRVTGTGPDHAREYTAEVVLDSTTLGTGHGRSKKQAEQHAAELACRAMQATAADADLPAHIDARGDDA